MYYLLFSDMNQSDVLQWLDGRLTKNASYYNLWDRNFPKPVAKRFDCGLIVKGILFKRIIQNRTLFFHGIDVIQNLANVGFSKLNPGVFDI